MDKKIPEEQLKTFPTRPSCIPMRSLTFYYYSFSLWSHPAMAEALKEWTGRCQGTEQQILV